VLSASHGSTEIAPMTPEFAQLHQFFVSDETQGAFSPGQSLSDIEGIFIIVFPSFASAQGQFGGIDGFESDSTLVQIDADEGGKLDSSSAGFFSGSHFSCFFVCLFGFGIVKTSV